MQFEFDERTHLTLASIRDFMDKHIYPNEEIYHRQLEKFGSERWQVPAILDELKAKAMGPGSGTCSCRTASLAAASTTFSTPR